MATKSSFPKFSVGDLVVANATGAAKYAISGFPMILGVVTRVNNRSCNAYGYYIEVTVLQHNSPPQIGRTYEVRSSFYELRGRIGTLEQKKLLSVLTYGGCYVYEKDGKVRIIQCRICESAVSADGMEVKNE